MYTKIDITDAEIMARRRALARELKPAAGLADVEHVDGGTFKAEGCEYMVLTDEEADAELIECVRESAWAFKASFILDYCGLNYEGAAESLEAMQGAKCEGANPFILAMIEKEKGGLAKFAEEAEQADGRAHFLNTYDGEELELAGIGKKAGHVVYYAYRMD